MNAVIAVNDKRIEKYIDTKLPSVTVLSVIRKRDQVIDTVLSRNPHLLVLSPALAGKTEMREIISSIRKLKPDLKIVYLYGERDSSYKAFLDFLIRQSIYDFIIDEITEDALNEAILNNATLNDVSCFLLTAKEKAEIEKEQEERKQSNSAPEQQTETKVLIVEKYIGNITVSVGGLFDRSGCTHTAIEICNFFVSKKCDVGLVVNSSVYSALKSYYLMSEQENNIKGCKIYDNPIIAKQNHKIVIYDTGNIYTTPEVKEKFYNQNVPILICPSAPWEIQKLTEFLKDNTAASAVRYLFFPISDTTFKEYSKNLSQGDCRAYKLSYNPEPFKTQCNAKIYSEIFKNILHETKKM